MTSYSEETCFVCFDVVNTNDINLEPDELTEIFHVCFLHLAPMLIQGMALQEIKQRAGSDELLICQDCCSAIRELKKIAVRLAKCEERIADLSIQFSTEVLQRRKASNQSTSFPSTSQTSQQTEGRKVSKNQTDIDAANNFVDSNILPPDMADFILEYLPENSTPRIPLGVILNSHDESNWDMISTDSEESFDVNAFIKAAGDKFFGDEVLSHAPVKVAEAVEVTAENGVAVPVKEKSLEMKTMNKTDHVDCENPIQIQRVLTASSQNEVVAENRVAVKCEATPEASFGVLQDLKPTLRPRIVKIKAEEIPSLSRQKREVPTRSSQQKRRRESLEEKPDVKPTFDMTRLRGRRNISYASVVIHDLPTLRTKPSSAKMVKQEVDVKPTTQYVCSVCSRRLATKQGLEGHMRIHTGEKPFKCLHCGKGYASKGGLIYHLNKCPSPQQQ